jgi:hypothetical protein
MFTNCGHVVEAKEVPRSITKHSWNSSAKRISSEEKAFVETWDICQRRINFSSLFYMASHVALFLEDFMLLRPPSSGLGV